MNGLPDDVLPLTDDPPVQQLYDLGYCPLPDCPNFGGVWRDCPPDVQAPG